MSETERDDGGPAFPLQTGDWSTLGLSVRDHFAGLAMQGLIDDPLRADQSRDECARLAYLMADAMLKARKA